MDTTPRTVDELHRDFGFPFGTFAEFRADYDAGTVRIGVGGAEALDYYMHGAVFSSGWSRLWYKILSLLPWAAVLAFCMLALASGHAYWLLALPLLVVGFIVFQPSMATSLRMSGMGCVNVFVLIVLLLATVGGVPYHLPVLAAIGAVLLIFWIDLRLLKAVTCAGLRRAIASHEELLAPAWAGNVFGLQWADGTIQWFRMGGRR